MRINRTPKVSIIIPSYNHLNDCLIPCIDSIYKYTNLDEVEIIVINQITDGSRKDHEEYFKTRPEITVYWYDSGLGYTVAINEGIKFSTGDYVLLLNNDTILLNQQLDQWINMLLEPFKTDPKVAITGPARNWDTNSESYFLIFFCVLISREAIDRVGLLDEIFSPGFGEDTDWCIKAERLGYKIVQVPDPEPLRKGTGKMMVGSFPIYHAGEGTFDDSEHSPKFQDLIKRNSSILKERYNNSQLPEGWFSDQDISVYNSILSRIPKHGKIAEIGTWKGRSLCSASKVIRYNELDVVAVDTFEGTESSEEEKIWHAEAKEKDIEAEFKENLNNFGLTKNVKVVRGISWETANLFPDDYFDFVFIDADHAYDAVKKDIEAWYPKVKNGGILAGHDWMWEGVRRALCEKVNPYTIHTDLNNMWYIDKKPMIYDCFMFANELDVLEVRLNELKDVVDFHVIVEAPITQSGLSKPLYLKDNLDTRFKDFKHKIIHIVVEDIPMGEGVDPWARERFQRDAISRGLINLNDNDIITISDADEIPKSETLRNYKVEQGLVGFEQDLSYYFMNCKSKEKWNWFRVLPYSLFKNMTPCQIRYTNNMPTIKDGGWHFSFMGGVDKIIEKIKSYAHQEYNNDQILNRDRILNIINNGEDVMGRGTKYYFEKLNNTYPKYLVENQYKFKENIMDTNKEKQENYKVICSISTKDRYYTTLPLTIQSVCMQTRKHNKLVIIDDGECKDLREDPLYKHIFQLLFDKKIEWSVIFGEHKGQHHNHQIVNNMKEFDFVWRIDDDEIANPDVLEKLLSHVTPEVGAVGGAVIMPNINQFGGTNKITDIYHTPNLQWTKGTQIIEVEHLYSSFIYRTGIARYDTNLSPVAHREETLFSHDIFRKGYKLIVDQSAVTYHLRQDSGGIRSHDNKWFYDHDEKIFTEKMESWGYKLIILNSGLGDHLAFKNILPELQKKYKHLIISNCYPEVFKDFENVTLVSIASVQNSTNETEHNIYKWMWDHNWDKSLVDAYRGLYLGE